MNLFENFELTNIFPGIIFILLGLFMNFFPPKKINSLYGYRTAASMKSQERWDFAQKYVAKKIIQTGILVVLLGLIIPFVSVGEHIRKIFGIATLMISILVLLLLTENALKNKFPKN